MQLCLLVVASANKLCQWEIQHELWRVLSMPVVYLVVFAVSMPVVLLAENQ